MMKNKDVMPKDNNSYRNLLNAIRGLIESGRRNAYASIEQAAILTFWNIGRKIVEKEQHGQNRAEYGKQVIKMLANELSLEYGNAISKRNLDYYRQFYLTFNDFSIVNTLVHNLS